MQINEKMGIERKLMYTGITSSRKGRIRIYYKGQPYLCGRCNTVHESQCPKRKEELIKEAEEKLDGSLKTKTLVVSDSTLRLTNQLALNADVTCIPGGQIGHLATSLNYNQQLLNYENVIIVGGSNNIDNGAENKDIERNLVFKQLAELGNIIKEQAATKNKMKFYFVTPIKAPSKNPVKLGDVAEMMRNMAHNSRGEVKIIDSHFITTNDELYEDDLHLNMTGTNLLLTEISKHVEGFKRKEAAAQQYKYSKVRSEYLWGCLFCAKEGHEEDTCATKNKSNKSSKNNKRDNGHLSSPENSQEKKGAKIKTDFPFLSFYFSNH